MRNGQTLYEPRHEINCFCICQNKGAGQLHGNCAANQSLSYAKLTDFILAVS